MDRRIVSTLPPKQFWDKVERDCQMGRNPFMDDHFLMKENGSFGGVFGLDKLKAKKEFNRRRAKCGLMPVNDIDEYYRTTPKQIVEMEKEIILKQFPRGDGRKVQEGVSLAKQSSTNQKEKKKEDKLKLKYTKNAGFRDGCLPEINSQNTINGQQEGEKYIEDNAEIQKVLKREKEKLEAAERVKKLKQVPEYRIQQLDTKLERAQRGINPNGSWSLFSTQAD
eukprot:g3135.t1